MAVFLRRTWTGFVGSEEMEENSDKTVYHWQFADNIQRLAAGLI